MKNATPSSVDSSISITVIGIVKSISYTVPSATTPGVTYEVNINPLNQRPMSCTCPARKPCRHMRDIAAGKFPCKPRVRFGPQVLAPVRPRIGTATAADLYA